MGTHNKFMIIFLYGEDSYRSRQKLNELKEKFRREIDPGGSSILTIHGESSTLEKINELISSSSLFAKKRMIVIERLFAQKSKTILDRVYEYFVSIGVFAGKGKKAAEGKMESKDENVVIFWEDIGTPGKIGARLWQALSREKYAQNFKTLSNTEVLNWIKEEVIKRGGRIRQQAAVSLASLFNGNLWQLSNEIDKLINFRRGRESGMLDGESEVTIEATDVDELVKGQLDANIFALTDAIGAKNKAQAARLFEQELESGTTESLLINMIMRQFRILLQVRQCLDKGESSRKIASQLKLHPFIVQKSLGQVRNFTLPALKSIFSQLIRIDKEIKSGRTESKTALSMLLAKI